MCESCKYFFNVNYVNFVLVLYFQVGINYCLQSASIIMLFTSVTMTAAANVLQIVWRSLSLKKLMGVENI
jgi:hypothetical protein